MKQKNISMLTVVYINELYAKESDDIILHEMAFDEENLKKLMESPAYKSALCYDALKYVH